MAEMLSCDISDLKSSLGKHNELACRGQIDTKQLLAYVKNDINGELSDLNDFSVFMVNHQTPILETHKLAQDLENSYKLGLLTNVQLGLYKLTRDKRLVPDLQFSPIILSCDEGIMKPDTKIYEIATKKAGLHPNEIFFIDDTGENIEAANEFGWSTYRFLTHDVEKSVNELRRALL
jgi:epoxide hydrolase-like predicted phosphatase